MVALMGNFVELIYGDAMMPVNMMFRWYYFLGCRHRQSFMVVDFVGGFVRKQGLGIMRGRILSKKTIEHINQDLGLERLVFFNDAVMSIAITLLTVDLKLSETSKLFTSGELVQELSILAPHLLSFLISFMVISVYWVSHHRYFRHIVRYDDRLIGLNLIFLLSVALMPFVAGMMGQYYYLPISGMIYAGAVAFTGFSMSAIWLYASSGHRLVEPNLDDGYIRIRRIILLVGPSVFLLSIPLALVSFPLMIAAWWLSPMLSFFILRCAEGYSERFGKGKK